MSKILIIYSSVHGQTRKIADHIKCSLSANGNDVECCSLDEAPKLDGFEKVILGASIRHGKHNPAVYDFITANLELLETKQTAFFSVSLVARKEAKNTAETNPYMQAFLEKTVWRPQVLTVFGGNLDYQGYSMMDRNIIRFIMWITKGPTAADTKVEYTDWKKVELFAEQLQAL
ncbi:menaquinone-dependent protoporphyrinogen IX dehydrogenase [Shewanella sp. UCD-KL12]|uniref:menaquinone-dependent protoporphyrinogen IX dehydrogenase n=1 Tax=Shewanella sp. UCD-KL12 TaxID=1917163 RepID=UPI0009707A62|nr:menaquinone-dependent protoporphyrinogen IX dehydrogenase [Shewanella sp. UCD-KL12]